MTTTPSPTTAEAAVVATIRDYFEGWFDADVTRMERALHGELVKRSSKHARGESTQPITTKARMLELTAAGEGVEDGADRRLEIEVHDVADDIATATVRSAVYHEYVHLARTDEGWKIVNALWRLN